MRRNLWWALAPCLLLSRPDAKTPGFAAEATLARPLTRAADLRAGDTVEVHAGLPSPSQLPANGRVAVEFGGYRKVLHALDPDFYMVFRAPESKRYEMRIAPVTSEEPLFNLPRWRETGAVTKRVPFPAETPWTGGGKVIVRASVKAVSFGTTTRNLIVEAEPNDAIATAQPVPLLDTNDDQTVHVAGGADDIEYFDNGKVGDSGDDWFRVEFKGTEPRLLTANLWLTDPLVVARIRCYTADGKEYREGQNENERVHQQQEEHRTEINRKLEPGGVYFLRVEANSPGYDMQVRVRRPAPFTDPRRAIRMAMYDHLAQVHAWLLNRPRGAAVERRIRDTGNLLGTHCMSCHTQSGVWGPTVPMLMGYVPENPHNYRELLNIMYQSLRPTNELKDAANNTSLAPLDLGDGPAGTRAAGYNVTTAETLVKPRKLQSMQQIRAANFMLLSNDPGGINAAGPGSNVGQAVVYRFAGEILKRAWEKTGEERYKAALIDKAEKMLNVQPKFSDDMSNRMDFLGRVFPKDLGDSNLRTRIRAQMEADERRLRQIQNDDGSWGFEPGELAASLSWKRNHDPKEPKKHADPAPTALGISALHAAGHGPDDPAIAKAVKWLLANQNPYGRWNRNAITGFVTTAYTLHALARLYPEQPRPLANYDPPENESLAGTIARFRSLAQFGLKEDDIEHLPRILAGASHESPQVRYYAMLGLGNLHDERGVEALARGLGDPVKMVREAARYGLRQTLLDDKGWDAVYRVCESGGDLARQECAAALIMRADTVMSKSAVSHAKLAALLDRMMNADAHPGVRAWAVRAMWNQWIWNPPLREPLNRAVVKLLARSESGALVENAIRYQLQALFIANGHRANGSKEHQYPELKTLFESISKFIDSPRPESRRAEERLVAIAATFYNQTGHDGGPGQMGYTTETAPPLFGKAIMDYWKDNRDTPATQLALESSASVTFEPLQKRLLDFSSNGPERLRTIAASSISDPRVVTLPASQEFVEPLVEQIRRGALDKDRRRNLSEPLFRLFSRARWSMPKTEDQQRVFFAAMIPRLADPASEPQWYEAENFGKMLAANPDFRTDVFLSLFPKSFASPLEEMLWLQSVPWIARHARPVPALDGSHAAAADPLADLRKRAADLYVRQLEQPADERLKKSAVAMGADIYLRNWPAVSAAIRKAAPRFFEADPEEVTQLNEARRRNFAYFRDFVMPEMAKPNRDDELACFSCHGVKGRVPSLELTPPDRAGFLSVKSAWGNYQILLERVEPSNPEASKLLRKPLNVQTGKEDGHQGGRRYQPGDPGYEAIRRWALDAAALRR